MVEPLHGFEGQDIRSLIDQRAERSAERPFLIWAPFDDDVGRSWTYGEFALAVRRFAAGLERRGLRAGDRLLIHFDNCPEALIAWLGAAYAGIVGVTTNTGLTQDELAHCVVRSGARGGVTQPRFASLVTAAGPGLEWVAVTRVDGGDPVQGRRVPGLAFEDIQGDPARLLPRRQDPMAHFAIQFTSGTTSSPKAVLWSHANALWGARVSAIHEGLQGDDVHLVHLPLFHTNAQVYSCLATLSAGGSVVLMPKFSASRFWPTSLRYRCTWTSMVPFCVRALQSEPVPAEHSYRRWGNAMCAPAADTLFGVTTIGWWGMTETVTHGIVGDFRGDNAPMSMGRPSFAYEVFVLDTDLRPVSSGEIGDLYIRGRPGVSLFLEYDGNPEATREAFTSDGLFKTGDRVLVGHDGALFFADRSKDMLKVGGENVAASEIEQTISAVAGVSEVAVVGRTHPMLDEVPVAFVVPTAWPSEGLVASIETKCLERLAGFKRPREIHLVKDLPRSTLGKISKASLREILASIPTPLV
jgi:crotonobetaine/carnitine-CoA ligase